MVGQVDGGRIVGHRLILRVTLWGTSGWGEAVWSVSRLAWWEPLHGLTCVVANRAVLTWRAVSGLAFVAALLFLGWQLPG